MKKAYAGDVEGLALPFCRLFLREVVHGRSQWSGDSSMSDTKSPGSNGPILRTRRSLSPSNASQRMRV